MWGHETTSKNQETKEMNHGGDNEASLVWNASAMSQHPVPVAEKRRRFHFCAPGESVGAPVSWFCGGVVLYGKRCVLSVTTTLPCGEFIK